MINYVDGDATQPIGEGQKLIVHCCNDIGAWGAGFVLALSKRWKRPEQVFTSEPRLLLGTVQFVRVTKDIVVANLVGQRGVAQWNGQAPIRYGAVREGMETVAEYARKHNMSIHMPRIGCGLAGGTWDHIEPILMDKLKGLDVVVYDLVTKE